MNNPWFKLYILLLAIGAFICFIIFWTNHVLIPFYNLISD